MSEKTAFTQSTRKKGRAPLAHARATGGEERVVGSRTLKLTSLDRVMYPETGFTKRELVDYMIAVAPAMLPWLVDRPVTLGRFPSGVHGNGFAQSECPGRPDWVRALPLSLANGEVKLFTLVDEAATLAFLAQMGTIELHPFLGTARAIDRPTDVVFDLDPGEPAGIVECAEVALVLRDRLQARGVDARIKTSGSVGLHAFVPAAGQTYDETRAFAQQLASEVVDARPHLAIDRMARAERSGKVLIDVRQNSERLSTVAAYSLRATPRPQVSTPVSWDEIATAADARDPSRLVFGPAEVLERVARGVDPWR